MSTPAFFKPKSCVSWDEVDRERFSGVWIYGLTLGFALQTQFFLLASLIPNFSSECAKCSLLASHVIPQTVFQYVLEKFLLQGLCLSPTQARALERDTRQQAKSPRWHKERALRLTASNFGVAATREVWSQKGLHNLTSTRDLSRVPAIRYALLTQALLKIT